MKPYPAAVHPRSHAPGVVAYYVYGEGLPGSLSIDDLVAVDGLLERCVPFASELLVFVPGDGAQQQLVATQRAALAAVDVDALMPGELRPDLVAEADGEGYGTLLVVPEGEVVRDYGPRDIVIATAAPNDISIVAGLVTRIP